MPKCSYCKLPFANTASFKEHRAGAPNNKRCLSSEEMEKKGMKFMNEVWKSRALINKEGECRKGGRHKAGLETAYAFAEMESWND